MRHSGGLEIKVVLLICQNCFIFFSVKVVFKIRQNCSLRSTLIFEVKSISCLEIKVRYEIRQNSLFITTRVLSYFRKYTSFCLMFFGVFENIFGNDYDNLLNSAI